MKKIFPFFILYFVAASVITTICLNLGVSASVFSPLKTLSKFLIVLAMAAIGLNTDIVKLVKTGLALDHGVLLLDRYHCGITADAEDHENLVMAWT